MKRSLWPAVFALFLLGTALAWVLTLRSGLPGSVYLYEAGRLTALMGFVILSFQYLWVSKIPFVETGMGLPRLIRFHRRLGTVGLVLLVLHPFALILSEALQGYGSPLGIFRMLGVLALMVLVVAAGAALFSRRFRLKPRTWKGIHRLAYLVFPIAFAHSFLLGTTLHTSLMRAVWMLLALIYLAHIVQRIRRSLGRP